jgi:DNA repair exonuclease SbcCD nuclease subunit
MAGRPLRFIHASDFRLEMPLQGMVEVPGHLRDIFCDAPYAAARRVFDAAVAEEAQFLLLSGNLLDVSQAGISGPLFLLEQFSRLADRGIAVYWAGGETDPPDAWPSAFPLPANVHMFPRGRTGQFLHAPAGAPLVRLVGQSGDGRRQLRPELFEPDPGGLPTVAVAHGDMEAATPPNQGICYWALGGRPDRANVSGTLRVPPPASGYPDGTRSVPDTLVHWPGSPQGRRPGETGIHGCTLVELDENGRARTSLLPTELVRWLDERLTVDENTGRKDLEASLQQRIAALKEAAPTLDLLIRWTVADSGPLLAELRQRPLAAETPHGPLAAELLAGLQSQYGSERPAAWSISLEAEPAATLPAALYEQETILGDFLRSVRQYEVNPAGPLDLESYVAESHLAGTLAAAASLPDDQARRRVLHEVALLGAELLGGGGSV